MSKIKKLSKDIVSKIAAGEVVERPSSVVKELIENSLDAGARNINISIVDGGFKEITVSDDGLGITRQDLHECFKRHTTSKIKSLQDLDGISSLGFRGEALASISAVSKLTISSRKKNSIEGYFVEVTSGKVTKEGCIGMSPGTRVLVRDLFYNVPARKKFLKNKSTELKKISDTAIQLSISHLVTSFSLSHNGKVIFNIPKDDNYGDRIKSVFSKDSFHNFFPVSFRESQLEIVGFVSKPQYFRSTKSKQYLYINNRYVRDSKISKSVRRAFGGLLGSRKHPVYVLFLNVPHQLVDVNVHPKKQKIRFINEDLINSFVNNSIKLSLQGQDLTHIKENVFGLSKLFDSHLDNLNTNEILKEQSEKDYILQIHDLYLLKQTEKGLLIIDQHAAHERIIYEQMMKLLESDEKSINLDDPFDLILDVSDSYVMNENLALFKKLGFVIAKKDDFTFTIKSIPTFLVSRNVSDVVKGVIDDIEKNEKPKRIDTRTKLTLSYLACRSAIKGGKVLNQVEKRDLIKKLEKTETNYVCPHGRPAKVEVPIKEINKWFKR